MAHIPLRRDVRERREGAPHTVTTVGVSLKMYFGYEQTLAWCRSITDAAAAAVANGVEVFVLPAYPTIPEVVRIFAGTGISVGAQDVSEHHTGAFTGEVSAAMLAELGASLAETGHAERRRLFHEDDSTVDAKTAAALAGGLTPVLCVGEAERGLPADAAALAVAELDRLVPERTARIIVAYEPHWAIGAAKPAPLEHIRAATTAMRSYLAVEGDAVLYGGSAGPGLLTALDCAVDGLFLGRFAHDPGALRDVLDEAVINNQRAATSKN
jgi:triosephosphate isomerase